MLAAWIRTKYPHLVDGAIAASAPVFWFQNSKNPPVESYDNIVTRTFRLSGCSAKSVVASLSAIKKLAQTGVFFAFSCNYRLKKAQIFYFCWFFPLIFSQTQILAEGREFLNTAFHLDAQSQVADPSGGDLLVQAVQAAMETLAMVDYPYPSDFLAPLPGWPIQLACKQFNSKQKKSPEDYALGVLIILNI
jgi:lysosomal Pro-X carboxypeptidase